MPITATFQRLFQVAGQSYNTTRQVPADVAHPFSVSVPAAKTGTVASGAGGTSGNLTITTGHGITTGSRLDVYWTGGRRRGCTVGTVSGTTVPISGGSGDNLPANGTAVTAMNPVQQTLTVPGASLVALAFSANGSYPATAVFADGSNVELYASLRTADNPSDVIVVADGTNPIGSGNTVASVFLSHDQSSAAQTLIGCAMND